MTVSEYAEGLLDDQKPLEVLYDQYEEYGEIVILKFGTKVAIIKREGRTPEELLILLQQMAVSTEV